MLCLNRREGERILLFLDGQRFGSIQVLEVRGRNIRLGFDLPHKVEIIREELVPRSRLEVRDNDGEPG